MSITIVGAGAIGGTVGAFLARAGYAVTLCDTDAAHVAAINARGISIHGATEAFTVVAPALTPDQLHGPLDIVLLAVKAQHTSAALARIAPLLAPSGVIVSLQNGFNEQTIADVVGPERTIGCLVNFSADYIEPGQIHYGGPGALEIGELDGRITPRLEQLRAVLASCGEIKLTNNIWGYIWGKIGYGNMLYATALVDASMADVIDRYRRVMVELATEVYAVADQLGIQPAAFDGVEPGLYHPRARRDWAAIHRSLDALVARRQRDQKQRSGIWRDLFVRHRHTEVDDQLGPVLHHGQALGLALPLTRQVVAAIHDLEAGRATPDWAHLAALEQLRQGHEPHATEDQS